MRRIASCLLILLLWMSTPRPIAAQEASPTPQASTPAAGETSLPVSPSAVSEGIISPAAGDVLTGLVTVTGATQSPNWVLSFAYADNPTGTWFDLASGQSLLENGTLSTWDTTPLTDGDYILRLRVFYAEGAKDYPVTVRIRNYSPLAPPTPTITLTPTVTASPTPPPPPPDATITPTVTPGPTSTPLPPNPAILTSNEIVLNLGKGALGVIAVFAVFGLLLALSRRLRL